MPRFPPAAFLVQPYYTTDRIAVTPGAPPTILGQAAGVPGLPDCSHSWCTTHHHTQQFQFPWQVKDAASCARGPAKGVAVMDAASCARGPAKGVAGQGWACQGCGSQGCGIMFTWACQGCGESGQPGIMYAWACQGCGKSRM
eukprot:1157823-Pelagomonas_calceolata.AAC.4